MLKYGSWTPAMFCKTSAKFIEVLGFRESVQAVFAQTLRGIFASGQSPRKRESGRLEDGFETSVFFGKGEIPGSGRVAARAS